MPSAYGCKNILADVERDVSWLAANIVTKCAERAIAHHMFCEWLGAFLAGWEATGDPVKAAEGALAEWDL